MEGHVSLEKENCLTFLVACLSGFHWTKPPQSHYNIKIVELLLHNEFRRIYLKVPSQVKKPQSPIVLILFQN